MASDLNDPAAALAAVRQGRESLLAAVDCPPSRHLAFAAVLGAYIAVPALPAAMRIGAFGVLIAMVALIVRWDKRRMGVFVSGYRAGRTRWVMAGLLAVVLPMYVLGLWFATEKGLRWPALVMAPVAGIFGYLMSGLWMRVFRREMLGVR